MCDFCDKGKRFDVGYVERNGFKKWFCYNCGLSSEVLDLEINGFEVCIP